MIAEMRSIFAFAILVATLPASLEHGEINRDLGSENDFGGRTRRALPLINQSGSSGFIFHFLKHKLKQPLVEKIPTTEPTANCICVPFYQCNANNTIITDGAGLVDLRLINTVMYRRCTGDLEVCCRLPVPIVMPTTTTTTTTPRPTTPTTTTTTTPRPTTPTTTTTTTPRPTTPTTTSTTTTTTTPRPTTMSTTTTTTTTTTPRPTTLTTVPPSMLCICVPVAQCGSGGYVIVDGGGIINPRQTLNPCPIVGQVCCRLPISEVTTPQPSTTTPFTVAPVPTPAPTPAPIPVPINCVCVQNYQCDANGYIIISGAGSIDPRFPVSRQGQVAGTCVSPTEICCRIPITGDDSVFGTIQVPRPASPIRYPGTPQACICVKAWECSEGNAVSVDGAGIIDPRFGACPSADEICCRIQGITRVLAPIANPLSQPSLGGVPTVLIVNGNSQPNLPATSAVCGIKGTTCLSAQACATNPGEASFAEFPWMVALLIRKPDGTSLFQCGGSMINTRTVLTAAHCVVNRPPGILIARFGEWDTAHNNEPAPLQEVEVQIVVAHPQHYTAGLYNDLAILILAKPATYAVNVMPICLPQQGITFPAGTRCWATGWGRSAFEGQYQTILRKVELPIVDRSTCENLLRATKLGSYFKLHGSFICAGGEASKDTCRGDGGGALVCPTATGQYVQAGIVSWGIGCGESNTPAVYANVPLFRQWIDQQLATYGVL